MDEPCDWDVCTEAATPAPLSQLSSRTEKRRAKSVTDLPEHSSQRRPEKTRPAPRQGAHGEENPRKVSPARDARSQSPPQAAQTRKELQDALPKIPPLSSFKSCKSRFMTFEEAERDFHSFIATGLGRSVEVIREFRGREDGGSDEQNGQRESVILNDDGAESLKRRGKRWEPDFSRSRSISASSSSQCDKDDGECRAVTQPQTEARPRDTAPKPKREEGKACTSAAPQMCPQTASAWPQPRSCESTPVEKSSRRPNQTAPAQEKIEKRSRKISERTSGERKQRERDEGEHDYDDDDDDQEEEEEEWSAESYWRASYRAWHDYYTSMSPFQEQGYQSYYSAAHNWMAAYRMNAVYMEELLKH